MVYNNDEAFHSAIEQVLKDVGLCQISAVTVLNTLSLSKDQKELWEQDLPTMSKERFLDLILKLHQQSGSKATMAQKLRQANLPDTAITEKGAIELLNTTSLDEETKTTLMGLFTGEVIHTNDFLYNMEEAVKAQEAQSMAKKQDADWPLLPSPEKCVKPSPEKCVKSSNSKSIENLVADTAAKEGTFKYLLTRARAALGSPFLTSQTPVSTTYFMAQIPRDITKLVDIGDLEITEKEVHPPMYVKRLLKLIEERESSTKRMHDKAMENIANLHKKFQGNNVNVDTLGKVLEQDLVLNWACTAVSREFQNSTTASVEDVQSFMRKILPFWMPSRTDAARARTCQLTQADCIKLIKGNGSCLFASIAHQVFGNQNQHFEVRKAVGMLIQRNWKQVSYLAMSNDSLECQFKTGQAFVDWLTTPNSAGNLEQPTGELELCAAAAIYGSVQVIGAVQERDCRYYQADCRTIFPDSQWKESTLSSKTLVLCYEKNGEYGSHYNTVLNPKIEYDSNSSTSGSPPQSIPSDAESDCDSGHSEAAGSADSDSSRISVGSDSEQSVDIVSSDSEQSVVIVDSDFSDVESVSSGQSKNKKRSRRGRDRKSKHQRNV